MSHVVFSEGESEEEQGYTVPIPEGLSPTFKPSKPVTLKQSLKFDKDGTEPYPGYGAEFSEWEKGWERVNRAQAIEDGAPVYESDTVSVSPEHDEQGEPVIYDETHVVVDPQMGEASAFIPE